MFYILYSLQFAMSSTKPKGKYTESLTFSTPNCIYVNYGKLGKQAYSVIYLLLLFLFTISECRKCMSYLLGETGASIMGVPEPLANR